MKKSISYFRKIFKNYFDILRAKYLFFRKMKGGQIKRNFKLDYAVNTGENIQAKKR